MSIISIIVPVYNVEKYIDRCIKSILAQTFTDFELILVDDGSPDRCGEICDGYAESDNRIRVIHQKNSKLSAARNVGMDIAVGKWIAFIDSDDWIHKDYLKILINGALDDTDIVVCECVETANQNEKDVEYTNVHYKNATLEDIQSAHITRTRAWGRIYRTSSLNNHRFISGAEPAEDACFNELFYNKDTKFRLTEAKLYYYYQRPDSAIHSHFGRGTLKAVRALIKAIGQIQEPDRRKRIISRCYKFVLSARYGEMFTEDYEEVLKQCKTLLKQLSKYRHELDLKERIVLGMMSRFPNLYRARRIHDDPTLIEFEKRQKEIRIKKR